jgi:hypothetical protein
MSFTLHLAARLHDAGDAFGVHAGQLVLEAVRLLFAHTALLHRPGDVPEPVGELQELDLDIWHNWVTHFYHLLHLSVEPQPALAQADEAPVPDDQV